MTRFSSLAPLSDHGSANGGCSRETSLSRIARMSSLGPYGQSPRRLLFRSWVERARLPGESGGSQPHPARRYGPVSSIVQSDVVTETAVRAGSDGELALTSQSGGK